MKLREIAHSRTGDKGNISNISVIAYRDEDYEEICKAVNAESVRNQLDGIARGEIAVYALPRLHALNIVLDNALGGGVTKSLAIDQHGKSLSSLLLEMEIGEA